MSVAIFSRARLGVIAALSVTAGVVHAGPVVQFISNNSSLHQLDTETPTSYGLSLGLQYEDDSTTTTAPADQPNWSASGVTGHASTSLTDNSVSISANLGQGPTTTGNTDVHRVAVDADSASITFRLLTESNVSLTGDTTYAAMYVGPAYVDLPLNGQFKAVRTGLMEPGVYTFYGSYHGSYADPNVPGYSGVATFTPTPEPTGMALLAIALPACLRSRRIGRLR